jgi:hypothetical protein
MATRERRVRSGIWSFQIKCTGARARRKSVDILTTIGT